MATTPRTVLAHTVVRCVCTLSGQILCVAIQANDTSRLIRDLFAAHSKQPS